MAQVKRRVAILHGHRLEHVFTHSRTRCNSFVGRFVRARLVDPCFDFVGVNAANEDEAMTKIEADFEDEGYALVEAEWIVEAAKMEWDDAEGEEEGTYLVGRLAAEPDEVVYGSLYEVAGDVSAAA